MSKIINIVGKNNELVASISEENIILNNDYKVIETNEDDACFHDLDGSIELIKAEGSA